MGTENTNNESVNLDNETEIMAEHLSEVIRKSETLGLTNDRILNIIINEISTAKDYNSDDLRERISELKKLKM